MTTHQKSCCIFLPKSLSTLRIHSAEQLLAGRPCYIVIPWFVCSADAELPGVPHNYRDRDFSLELRSCNRFITLKQVVYKFGLEHIDPSII